MDNSTFPHSTWFGSRSVEVVSTAGIDRQGGDAVSLIPNRHCHRDGRWGRKRRGFFSGRWRWSRGSVPH